MSKHRGPVVAPVGRVPLLGRPPEARRFLIAVAGTTDGCQLALAGFKVDGCTVLEAREILRVASRAPLGVAAPDAQAPDPTPAPGGDE